MELTSVSETWKFTSEKAERRELFLGVGIYIRYER